MTTKAHFSMMSNKRTNPDSAGDAVGKKKGMPVKSNYNLSDAVNLVRRYQLLNLFYEWTIQMSK